MKNKKIITTLGLLVFGALSVTSFADSRVIDKLEAGSYSSNGQTADKSIYFSDQEGVGNIITAMEHAAHEGGMQEKIIDKSGNAVSAKLRCFYDRISRQDICQLTSVEVESNPQDPPPGVEAP